MGDELRGKYFSFLFIFILFFIFFLFSLVVAYFAFFCYARNTHTQTLSRLIDDRVVSCRFVSFLDVSCPFSLGSEAGQAALRQSNELNATPIRRQMIVAKSKISYPRLASALALTSLLPLLLLSLPLLLPLLG